MQLRITAETSLWTEIEIVTDDRKILAAIEQKGGTWYFQVLPNGGHEWLASERVSYFGAVKRAIDKAVKAAGIKED
jgi:hypothetical protein